MGKKQVRFKWGVTVSEELMFLEIYSNCGVTNAVILLLCGHKIICHCDF